MESGEESSILNEKCSHAQDTHGTLEQEECDYTNFMKHFSKY